jgi:hypothetical protein
VVGGGLLLKLDSHVDVVGEVLEVVEVGGDLAHLGECGNRRGGRVDDGDAVAWVVVDDVSGPHVGVERPGLGEGRGQFGVVLIRAFRFQVNVVSSAARKSFDTSLSLIVAVMVRSRP